MGSDHESGVRIDKWLWAVRIFKTRSLATEMCKKGKALIDDQPVKPSRTIQIGEIIKIKNPPVYNLYKVTGLAEKRMGAKLVKNFLEDITPEDQIEILEFNRVKVSSKRQKGTGRPTKRERRDLDDFLGLD